MKILSTRFLLAFAAFSIPLSAISASSYLGQFSAQQVCKATISTVMGKSPAIMKIDRINGNVTYLSYVRPDDGKRWAYRCKLEGLKAIWASDTGRWRTHSADPKITFSIDGSSLNITEMYSDGSARHESFTVQQLGG